MSHNSARRRLVGRIVVATAAAAALAAAPLAANAAAFPSDGTKPDLVSLLSGYSQLWASDGANDLHGTVKDAAVLSTNDKLAVWINNNATPAQQFRALQDSEYNNAQNTAYDQSFTVSEGLGTKLSAIYVQGLNSGRLPLTQALINSSNGTSGAYVSTTTAKGVYSYPRPFLAASPTAAPVPGDDPSCAPSLINGSSLTGIRQGKSYADASGALKIVRVAATTDTSHQFSPSDVPLDAGYSTAGICTGGAFPSGHTTTAYQAGVTLATLVPELGTEVLARASENGNNRIVLGVHYPLDIVGGRISGEAALAARWSDATFRTQVLEPARQELVNYLQQQCGGTITSCAAKEKAYADNPYGGKAIPGGSSQIVTDRASALKVYTERLTYGFAPVSNTRLAPAVPAGASNLLLTAFPQLTDAQRTSVLAQTEIASGFPLDQTTSGAGSWQRLNLAAAMSATVQLASDGSVKVVRTGGTAQVLQPQGRLSAPNGTKVAQGGSLKLSGSGFAPGQTLTLVLHSRGDVLAKVTTDARGGFGAVVTIPRQTAPGCHSIEVVTADNQSVSRPLSITVTSPSHGGWPTRGHQGR